VTGSWSELEDLTRVTLRSYVDAVLAVSRIPYGRTSERSGAAVLREGVGTCSTKHVLLRDVVSTAWPAIGVTVWHRLYVVTPETALRHFGVGVASVVPAGGVRDVHTYATFDLPGDRSGVVVDATFPVDAWDGVSDLELACGEGPDEPAGDDVFETKERLVAHWCDPVLREPFIAALAALQR